MHKKSQDFTEFPEQAVRWALCLLDDTCSAESILRLAFSVTSLLVMMSSGDVITVNYQVSLGHFTTAINFKYFKCLQEEI